MVKWAAILNGGKFLFGSYTNYANRLLGKLPPQATEKRRKKTGDEPKRLEREYVRTEETRDE